MNEKKQAIVISAYDYYENRAEHICNLLKQNGYETVYLIAGYNHYTKKMVTEPRPEATVIPTIAYEKNVSLKRILSCLIFSKGVMKKIAEDRPALVYSIIPPNSLSFRLGKGKKKYGYKLALDIIDSWPESFSIGNKWVALAIKPFFAFWRWVRNHYVDSADVLIGVSEMALSQLPQTDAPRRLLYPLPKAEGHDPGEVCSKDPDTVSLCYMGGINKLLNIDRVAEIVSSIGSKKRVHFHIIGAGEKKEYFINELKKAGAEIFDHGAIFDWEEKLKIYEVSDFGINVPNPSALVTMSLKGSEYFCASLPVISEAMGDTENIIAKYHTGINSTGLPAEEVAELICNFTREQLSAMKKATREMYRIEFEGKLNEGLLSGVMED